MNKCIKCEKNPTEGVKKFCSMDCRRCYMSDMMIKKSVAIKKKYGNAYYSKPNVKE